MGGDISSIGEVGLQFRKRKQGISFFGASLENYKKKVVEKASTVGRKDLEKIKMMGETLVELGFVKNLYSHFCNPLK